MLDIALTQPAFRFPDLPKRETDAQLMRSSLLVLHIELLSDCRHPFCVKTRLESGSVNVLSYLLTYLTGRTQLIESLLFRQQMSAHLSAHTEQQFADGLIECLSLSSDTGKVTPRKCH